MQTGKYFIDQNIHVACEISILVFMYTADSRSYLDHSL